MILRLLLFVLFVGSVAQAQVEDCPPADPVEAERLRMACRAVLSEEVRIHFREFAKNLTATSQPLEQSRHDALSNALLQAAQSLDAVVVVADLRHCRVTSTADDDCDPALNILNTGLTGYDPNDPDRAAVAERPLIGRMAGHGHPEFQPPAFTELRCFAFSAASDVPPNPSFPRADLIHR